MASEMEFVNYKDFVENLAETESLTSSDKVVVSNPTSGPRSMPGSAKDRSTTITAFRTGDVIPVDGPNGAAKMPKGDLLKETAQNALVGNVAQAFDPTRPSENPYKAGESVAYYGKTYIFNVDHYGAWSDSDVKPFVVADEVNEIGKRVPEETSQSYRENSVVIYDDENNKIVEVDDDGVHVKDVFVGFEDESRVIPNNEAGKREVNCDSVIIYDDEDNKIVEVDDDGIHAKDVFVYDGGEEVSVKDLVGSGDVEVILPNRFTAVVGDTLQLFYQGMIKVPGPESKYNILVTCSKGKQFPRYFEFTPAAGDDGSYSFKITIKNNNGKVVGEKTCYLDVVAKLASSPATDKKIVCIGDSLTAGGDWCAEAFRRLCGIGGTPVGDGLNNISFCGSMTKNGAGYFGVGGWTWKDYTTVGRRAFRFQVSGVSSLTYGAVYQNDGHDYTIIENNTINGIGNILCAVNSNYTPDNTGILTKSSGAGDNTISYSSFSLESQNPFWNYSENKLSFQNYADTYCGGTIDYLYALLTWNGMQSWQNDFSNVESDIKRFADVLHLEFPSAKLKLTGIQVPSVTGGMGANYGATGSSYADTFGMIATACNYNEFLKSIANDPSYSSFVDYIGIAPQFDTLYNMPFIEKNVNTRNSSKTEIIGTNGVHPSNSGYMQIGDAVYRDLIKTLTD
jgi:hypothetical protein